MSHARVSPEKMCNCPISPLTCGLSGEQVPGSVSVELKQDLVG